MADLFIDRHMGIDAAGGCFALVVQIFGKAEQDADGQLVVEEAALDIAALRHAGARLKADKVADGDAEGLHVVRGLDGLVQHDLHGVPAALCGGIIAVDMDGGIDKLQRALVAAGELRHDAAVLCLGVVGVHAADVHDAQAAVALDLGDHAAERIGVGLEQQGVICAFAAEIDENAALGRPLCRKAERAELAQDKFLRLGSVARRAVDGQQLHRLLHGKIHIVFHEKYLPPPAPRAFLPLYHRTRQREREEIAGAAHALAGERTAVPGDALAVRTGRR